MKKGHIFKRGDYGMGRCECCGKEFKKNSGGQRYCSEECKKEAYAFACEVADSALENALSQKCWRKCAHCGRGFFAPNEFVRYCSKACRYAARDMHPKEESEPQMKKDGFTWEMILKCMQDNRCQYARALEILEKERLDALLGTEGDSK